MNNQEVFDTVARHLFAQGRRSVVFEQAIWDSQIKAYQQLGDNPEAHMDREDYESCCYRAPDGSKCAVGCLIPDSLYQEGMERKGVNGLLFQFSALNRYLYDVNKHMLSELQAAHDDACNWVSTHMMQSKLRAIATSYFLNSDIVETLSFKDR